MNIGLYQKHHHQPTTNHQPTITQLPSQRASDQYFFRPIQQQFQGQDQGNHQRNDNNDNKDNGIN